MKLPNVMLGGLGWLVGLGVAANLEAAVPKTQPIPGVQRGQEIEIEGTIGMVGPGMIQLRTLTGELWLFRIPPTAKVEVKGTAEKSFLRPGMFVRFRATVDPKGHATSKVPQLTIRNPSIHEPPAMIPEAGGLISPEPAGPRKKKEKETVPLPYQVFGRISSVKDGQYLVLTPQGAVTFELEETAKIDVDMTNLICVRRGDRVAIKGVVLAPGRGEAKEVRIELSSPLTGPETAHPKKKSSQKPMPLQEAPHFQSEKTTPKKTL